MLGGKACHGKTFHLQIPLDRSGSVLDASSNLDYHTARENQAGAVKESKDSAPNKQGDNGLYEHVVLVGR